MSTTLFLQLVGTVFASGVVTVVINAIVQRKNLGASTGKLSAEATQVISEAASGLVESMEKDYKRLRGQMDTQLAEHSEERGRLMTELEVASRQYARDRAEWEIERREWRRVLQVHAAWDTLAITAVQKAIPPIDLPLAPPLTPPTLPRADRPSD